MITNTQLEYLVAVDRYGSFSIAARRCFVTQPTLSMQIQKLEAELGVSLFDRGRKPVRATPIGRLVMDRAYRALREFNGIAQVVRDQRERPSGELRIGIIPTLGPYLLPRFIPGLLESYREVQVTVRELLTGDIIQALRRDTLDVGIAATPLEEKGIRETPLFYEPFYGLVAAGHPLSGRPCLSTADLVADEMILMNSGHCLHDQVFQLCMGGADHRAGLPAFRLRFASGSLEGLIRIVESGHGLTLLPELAVMTLADSSRPLLRPLEPPIPARQVSLVVHGEGVKTRLLEILRQAILDAVPRELKEKKRAWRIIGARPG